MERFVVDGDGRDERTLVEGFRWLLAYARDSNTEAAIIVPSVRSIDNLGHVVGTEAARVATKHRQLTIDGIAVHLYTPRTQPNGFTGPVLVPWADSKMVEGAERLGSPAVCATGWVVGQLDDWKRVWDPIDPRTGMVDSGDGERDAGAEVRGAVASLTSGLGGDDVVHAMDKRRAVNAFRALRMLDIAIDPVLVRGLAIEHGWSAGAADRLERLADSISNGRPVRGGNTMNKTAARQLVAGFTTTRR